MSPFLISKEQSAQRFQVSGCLYPDRQPPTLTVKRNPWIRVFRSDRNPAPFSKPDPVEPLAVLPLTSCKVFQFDMRLCELNLDIVLIEAEIPVLLAPELGMAVHVIDGQALADVVIMSNFLRSVLDVAGLLLLAEEVLVGNAQIFDGLLRDVVRHILQPFISL